MSSALMKRQVDELNSTLSLYKEYIAPPDDREDYKVSDLPEEYIILSDDYLRNCPKELNFMTKYKSFLLSLYSNKCALCEASTNGLEIDHYLLPKAKGGTFQLRHRNGHLVGNAVVLCTTCNRKKKDKSYRDFCTEHQIDKISFTNSLLTRVLNRNDRLSRERMEKVS